jgi:hypothetical protein
MASPESAATLKETVMNRAVRTLAIAVAASSLVAGGATVADAATNSTKFDMVRSDASVKAGCLARAGATVKINSIGPVEVMTVKAYGLPKNTDFDLFVTQTPDAPFGLSWYQGDLESDRHGKATGRFVGRFSRETFTVAPGEATAPRIHSGEPFTNPATGPVHQFHLGIWFNSPADANEAGCAPNVTPFNGDHSAGVQALSTRNFSVVNGPLARVKS